MKALNILVKSGLSVEKMRVASEVRISHLALQNRQDEETDKLHGKLVELEGYIDGRVSELLKDHPAYPWFSRVKGIGKENIGKIVGLVRVSPSRGMRKITNEDDEEQWIEADLPFAATISGLWKFAGLAVEDGKAPRREEGKTLSYNSQLRSMCWRVGVSLMRAGGVFYDYYVIQKERLTQRYTNEGWKIVPTAKLPTRDGKKKDGDGYISEGHLHNMALRKCIKLFLACLWLTWREGEGLPVTKPYAIDVLKHDSFIDPWSMTDRASKRE